MQTDKSCNSWRVEAIRASVEKHAREIGLAYSAVFLPQSKSRNANDKTPTLNWRVSLERSGRKLATDYQQGIGHVPNYPHAWSSMTLEQKEHRDACVRAAETGKYPKRPGYSVWTPLLPLDPPTLADVMHSLCLDSDVLDAGGFESWAADLGYDADSRRAEAIYRACLDIALQLRGLIGDDNIARFRELVVEL